MNSVTPVPTPIATAAAVLAAHHVTGFRWRLGWSTAIGLVCLLGLAAPHSARAGVPRPSPAQIKIEERALRIFATRQYLSELRRAERTTYSLLQAATPYCANRRKFSLGPPPLSAQDLPPELRQGFGELVDGGRAEAARFMHVHSLSPVARAGVQEGDIFLSATDLATGKEVSPSWTINRPTNTYVINERITLEVERGGKRLSLPTVAQVICDYQLKVLRTDRLIARSEAGMLTISTGLLRFLPNDDELVVLLANEVIHDQLRLAQTSSTKRRSTTPADADAPFAPDEEFKADYLGAYLAVAARANFVQGVNVWKRFASIPANQVKEAIALRHPLSATRSFSLTAIGDEIRRKTQTGERMVPNAQSMLHLNGADFDAVTANNSAIPGPTDKPVSAEELKLRAAASSIPFIDNEGITGYQRFLNSPMRPRAFAIGPNRGGSGGGAWSYKSGANAAADALAHCSLLSRGPCYLYAVDDQIVWNPATARDQPENKQASAAGVLLMEIPPASGFAKIADLAAVPLPQSELGRYQAFLEKPSPRAFVVTQNGTGRYWVGPAAMHDALAYCARAEDGCWLYAVDDVVVWSKDPAQRISSRDQLKTNKDESGFLEK